MANLIRIGNTLINLDYLASVALGRPDDPPPDVETIYMDQGRALYFEGEDAEAVRRMVRTFPGFPATDPGAEGPVEYSSGSEVLSNHAREAHQGK